MAPADKGPAGAASQAPTELPTIVLEFDGPDRANVTAKLRGVTPAQLYGAAWYLDALAHEVRQGTLTQTALAGMVPGGDPALQRVVQSILGGKRD